MLCRNDGVLGEGALKKFIPVGLALWVCISFAQVQTIQTCTPLPSASSKDFEHVMAVVAEGWNRNDARLASECFTNDALYSSPPSPRIREGRAALFEFFGGVHGRPQPMQMEWHHLVYDQAQQLGTGEYTFRYKITTHGIVIVKLRNGLISNWREYEIESPLPWNALVGKNQF
jgi:hypothetical protein